MPWFDTDNYKDKVKAEKNVKYDLEKLERWERQGWTPRFIDAPKFVTHLKYARVVKLIARINPQEIPFDFSAGFSCQNCGLYNRHPFCSPDRPQFEVAEREVKSYKNGVVFIVQNDGNSPWSEKPTELAHIKFKDRFSFELRGAEIGTSRYLKVMMKHIEHHARRIGYSSQGFLSGQCTVCGGCPLKSVQDDNNIQVPCILGGLPSLETWWMNVYRWKTYGQLGKIINSNQDILKPFKFICDTHFTLVGMLLYDRKVRKYWYDSHIRSRLNDPGVKDKYRSLAAKLRRAMQNRKNKGIPR